MKLADVAKSAFAMPLTDPAYPRGPYKFYNREFVVISYRSDPDVLREVVPEPLEVAGDTVNYKFIRMPDSTGFGDYTETGQVIPVRFRAADGTVQEGGYVHAMYLDDNSPIAGGREIWGFPKKLATPKITHESETLVCTLHYGSVMCESFQGALALTGIERSPILQRDAALAAAREAVIDLGDGSGRIPLREGAFCVYPTLVWRPCEESRSPFYPFHQITVGGVTIYVGYDGRVYPALHDLGRG
jgi:Acetoacetate decarboxylase (ADC)